MKKNLLKRIIRNLLIITFIGGIAFNLTICNNNPFKKINENKNILTIYKPKEIKLEEKDSQVLKKYKSIYNVNLELYNLSGKEDEIFLMYDKACIKYKDKSFNEALESSFNQLDKLKLDRISEDGQDIQELELKRYSLLKDADVQDFSKKYIPISDNKNLFVFENSNKDTKNISANEYLKLGTRKLIHKAWDEQAKALIEMRDKISKME